MAAIRPGTGSIAAAAVRRCGRSYGPVPTVDRDLARADGAARLLG